MNLLPRLGLRAAVAASIFYATLGPGSAALAQEGQDIRIRMGDQSVTATLNGSAAARDLVSMLPLTLHMRDFLDREKVARLPGSISTLTSGVPTYAVGDLGYWRPSGNFVIYYLHDGTTLPSPGIVPLGKIHSGVEIFNTPGDIDVTVELAK